MSIRWVWSIPGALLLLTVSGCGQNFNRQGNQAGTEPNTITGEYTGISWRALPENESLGSMTIGRETTLGTVDREFVREAGDEDLSESELGRLAWSNSPSGTVRAFGNEIFKDHETIHDELLKIAANNDILLPYEMDGRAAAVGRLVDTRGQAFDQQFLSLVIAYDQRDIARFENELRFGTDASVRWFASQMLPLHQKHLHDALDMARKLNLPVTPQS